MSMACSPRGRLELGLGKSRCHQDETARSAGEGGKKAEGSERVRSWASEAGVRFRVGVRAISEVPPSTLAHQSSRCVLLGSHPCG